MPELNEKQRTLLGKWELAESENFEEFLKEFGVNAVISAVAMKMKPKATLSVDGDEWTIKIETMIKSEVVKFKMGQKFEHTTPFGVKLSCILEMDENGRITETQEMISGGNKGQVTHVVRYVENDKMITLMRTNNVEAKRVFVRVD